jgi:hypothetical protein
MTFIPLHENNGDEPPIYVVFKKITALRAGTHRWEDKVWPYTEVVIEGGRSFFVKETPEEIGKLADKWKA